MTTLDLSFPRAARLRRSGDYRRVQSKGRRFRQAHLLAVVLPHEADGSRVGLTVSRKVGGAVIRNRVKRWLREAVRHERSGLSGSWDVVFIAHPSAATADHAAIRQQVREVFRAIGRSAHHQRKTP